MKKIIILLIVVFIFTGNAFAQVESGDREIGFMGFYSTFVGDDVETNGFGSLQLSYGKYFGRNLQLGIAPIFSFSTSEDDDGDPIVDTQISGSVFVNLNLTTASKTVPYITGRYYQYSFDIPDDAEFSDYSYMTVGAGIKNFINEYALFNTVVTYGFSPNEDNEGGIIMILTGFSVIF
ncbi:hypothetical protein KAH55_08680 [bacterium]|nr:hypothetical protein [bacterium]